MRRLFASAAASPHSELENRNFTSITGSAARRYPAHIAFSPEVGSVTVISVDVKERLAAVPAWAKQLHRLC